jgi:leucyl-tRNA synthetase
VLALDAVSRALDGKAPKKVIVVPQRIVNVVA